MKRDRHRRPINPRQAFIDGVVDVMNDLDREYDHEVAEGMWPFIKIAEAMAREDIERLKKRRRVEPPKREAEE